MNTKIPLDISRDLTIQAKGQSSIARLRIHSIELKENGKWLCTWSIDFLCPRGAAFGNDPTEALITCIKIIGVFINGTEIDGTNVWWQKPGDNGGFPILKEHTPN